MTEINVRDFVHDNITPYKGDASFLLGPSKNTKKLRDICVKLLKKEHEQGGLLDVDIETIPSVNAYKPGYIQKNLEKIVGLQADAPLKRLIKPYGGRRIVKKALEEHGLQIDPKVLEVFTKYRKTHNDGIFDTYTDEMRVFRKVGIITGLPDNYARGRIIGDYRRIALYGIDILIEEKQTDKENIQGLMTPTKMRLIEEISEQIRTLDEIKQMSESYGFDISKAAKNAQEAVQRTYFGYLAAVKEQDGAAMSLGNVSSFLDIYIQKDLEDKKLNEEEAQELIDHFVMKLRLVRHLRMDAYNQLFSGDPTWVTESIGGMFSDGRTKVTKTSFRFLQTLYNLGPSPEPNLTVLWSTKLPEGFKNFCTRVSIDTSSIQYENDDLIRDVCKVDDYGIACCVSQMEIGKQMQFFGARCNLAKALLYAINEGTDELKNIKIVDNIAKLSNDKELDYKQVWNNYKKVLSKVAEVYANTMNIIHYMHDKYYYEKAQMSLMDSYVHRTMAYGVAGLSVVADSLSAIKYAKVKAIRDENGISKDFKTIGEYPKYGNDDDKVDYIAKQILHYFMEELRKHDTYRDAEPTLSVLTITSNVVYGKKTGTTPDGRDIGEPFAPGANPMHGRDTHGAIASLDSVAKLSYWDARDGISNTFSIVPQSLGSNEPERIKNLTTMLDGYFQHKGFHLNVNVFDRETLLDAQKHPEKYPQLTIRVSGYAVNFNRLTKEQQDEVISRTFHESM